MKILASVLFVMLWAPISFAQSEDEVEFQQIETERAVVNSDAAKEEADEAKEMAKQEKAHQAQVKAEAVAALKESWSQWLASAELSESTKTHAPSSAGKGSPLV